MTGHRRINDRAEFVVVDNRECVAIGRSCIVYPIVEYEQRNERCNFTNVVGSSQFGDSESAVRS